MKGSKNLQKETRAELIWLEIPLMKGLGLGDTVTKSNAPVDLKSEYFNGNKVLTDFQLEKKTKKLKDNSENKTNYNVTDQFQKSHIKIAMNCNWALRDKNIKVTVSENIVTLTGSVNSWYQLEQAERISWKAPGVLAVNNHLVVEYNY